MKKWLLRLLYAAVAIAPVAAFADYQATQGSGSTVFAFVCSTTKICPAFVLIDSSNVEKGTSGNPVRTDPTGTTTQPVSAAALPLPSGAATSANQSSQITQETAINTVLGTQGDSACGTATGTCSVAALLKYLNNVTNSAIPAGSNSIGSVGYNSQYPVGATAITASATGTTGATTATLAGTSGKTTFICSLSVRSNATAAATGNATVTGTTTGTMNYTHWTAPLASGIGVTEQIFSPCVPASASNTGIAVASPAPGSGGTVSVSASGYQL